MYVQETKKLNAIEEVEGLLEWQKKEARQNVGSGKR